MEDRVDEVSGEDDKFPVGLRVLVVDDDLCCLKLVEAILKKCKFNVTTTNQPMEALKMLREDKNRFEIVITDVNMPGMDGFKLLELIGLEMDLPVIMLSAHSDPKYVMKGVQHGACDYLVKPCRMLELQNIWLHVFKRKHMSQKDKNNNNNKNSPNQDDEQGLAQPENPETSDDSKAGQKRKDRNEEDENGEIETEDPAATQKKPRVVWSLELHQKFVAAITHLTIEKAVPKKILDWMNIEGLTRENVASHLQKYRLYLKRIEAAKNKQENSMHMRSIEGFGLPETRRFPTIPFSSTPSSGVRSRFNCPSRLNMDGIVSPGLIQQNTSQNTHNSFSLRGKLLQSQLPELFQGNPRSLEVNPINNLSGFSHPTSFPNNRVGLASLMNPGPRLLANHLLLQRNQHVLGVAPLKSESFDISTNVASNLLGHDQSKRDWQQEVHLSKFPPTGFGTFETHYHHEMPLNNSRLSHAHSPIGLPSMTAVQNPQPNFLVDVPCQEDLIGSVIQTVNCSKKPNGEEHKPVFGHNPNYSAMTPLPLANEIMGHNDMATINNPDISGLIAQSSDSMVSFEQLDAVDKPLAESRMNFNANNFLNAAQDGFFQSDFDALEDMVSVDDKHEPNDRTALMDEVFWRDVDSDEPCTEKMTISSDF